MPRCMKDWLELAVTVPADAADAVGNHLIEIGAPGIIEEDAGGAPATSRLRAHCPGTTVGRELSRELRT
ncbi:MAG: hypothetical protein ACREQ9_16935, partial [Candidatus Binatia bacterium]